MLWLIEQEVRPVAGELVGDILKPLIGQIRKLPQGRGNRRLPRILTGKLSPVCGGEMPELRSQLDQVVFSLLVSRLDDRSRAR